MTTRLLRCGLLVLWLVAPLLAAQAPANLRCEWRVNPADVRDPCPELAWDVPSQSACRVVVTRAVGDGAQPVWDSGKLASRLPIVEYAGPPLDNGVDYAWRVQVWDAEGRLLPEPPAQRFRLNVQPMPHHLPTIRTFINFAGTPEFARDWLDLCFRPQAKHGRADVLVVCYGLVCTMVLPHPSTGRPLSGKAKELADFCVAHGLTKQGIAEDMFCHFARDTLVSLHIGAERAANPRAMRLCRGWDPRNDRNGDGIVDSAELAALVNAEATAVHPREARIPIYFWGPPNDDFVMNVGHPAYREFMATVHAPRLCQDIDGIYFDTVPPRVPAAGGRNPVVEYPERAKWLRDLQMLFASMKTALPDKMITGNGWDATPMVLDGRQVEGWQHLSRQADAWKARLDAAIERDRRGKVQLIQYNPIFHPELAEFGPKLPVTMDRDKLFGLATYLLAHGRCTYFGFGRHPYRNVTKLWFQAMRHDLGKPDGPYFLFDETDRLKSVDATSLLRNGGFEAGDADNNPTVWRIAEPVELDRHVTRSGAASARIASTDPLINNFSKNYVRLKPHTAYTLIAWAKTDKVAGRPGAQVYPYEFDGAQGGGMLTWTGTGEWSEKRMAFTTGADAEGRITFRMYGATGTAWFDDIQLVEGVAVKQRVFARRYTKGLVLVKPYIGGSFGDDTRTTHKLPGAFRPLRVDGTLGEPLREVTLRNAEAAILAK